MDDVNRRTWGFTVHQALRLSQLAPVLVALTVLSGLAAGVAQGSAFNAWLRDCGLDGGYCFSLGDLPQIEDLTPTEFALEVVGNYPSVPGIEVDLEPMTDLLSELLGDPATLIRTGWPDKEAVCIFNRDKGDLVQEIQDILSSYPTLAATSPGCAREGGVPIFVNVPDVVVGSPNSDPSELPGDELDEPESTRDVDNQSSIWDRVSQDVLDAYVRSLTIARVAQWGNENEARSLANKVSEERLKLVTFWSGDVVTKHNQSVIEQQRFASRVIFWICVGLVGLGVILTIIQFSIAIRTGGKVRDSLPVIGRSPSAAGVPSRGATVESMELAQTELKFEMEKIGLTIKTSIIGVVILIASFGFFFLYLRFAFPVSFPDVPAIEESK